MYRDNSCMRLLSTGGQVTPFDQDTYSFQQTLSDTRNEFFFSQLGLLSENTTTTANISARILGAWPTRPRLQTERQRRKRAGSRLAAWNCSGETVQRSRDSPRCVGHTVDVVAFFCLSLRTTANSSRVEDSENPRDRRIWPTWLPNYQRRCYKRKPLSKYNTQLLLVVYAG